MPKIDEPICISDYQASWPVTFESERQRLIKTLNILAEDVEHIGSTAVPGLPAKPTIDIMVGVPCFLSAQGIVTTLELMGYESLGEAGVPGRHYLRTRGTLQANLHLVLKGGDHWVNNLALRDYLRANSAARVRYAKAKRDAVASGACSLLAYSDAKADTVRNLLLEAIAARYGRR
jgi:GrpB-like predicted nucleotidyltransferase (UPF0157 family)